MQNINIKRINNLDEYYKQISWYRKVNKELIYSCSFKGSIYDSEIEQTQTNGILIHDRTKEKYKEEILTINNTKYDYEEVLTKMFELSQEEPTPDIENVPYLYFGILQNNETKEFEVIYYVADIYKDIKKIEDAIGKLYECQMRLNDIYIKQEDDYANLVKNYEDNK